MTIGSRPTTLPLNNDVTFHLEKATVDRVLSDALALRGFLGASEDATGPIQPSLAVTLTAEGNNSGDYHGTIAGALTNQYLRADYLGKTVWPVLESVPPGSFRDAFPVTVVENQSG